MPAFALDLDHDGIRLLTREGDGWIVLQTVRLDDARLADRMAEMRAAAETLGGPDFETALIIPPSEILYTTVDVPAGRTRLRDSDVATTLEGLTPCPVDELVFDWRRDGDKLRVAALDINTLNEAEAFALQHRLNPVGFTARPTPDQFPDAPDFGPTQVAQQREDAAKQPEEKIEPEAPPVPVVEPEPETAPIIATVQKEPRAPAPKPAPQPAISAPAPGHRLNSSPWTGLTDRKGPGLTALVVLTFAAILIWIAYALVTPESEATSVLPPVAETPRTAEGPVIPDDGLPSETARAAAEEPSPTAPAPSSAETAPNEMYERREFAIFVPDAAARGGDAELPPPVDYAEITAAEIWQTPPPPGRVPAPSQLDTLYLASIDPAVRVGDAFALSPVSLDPGFAARPATPPPAGQVFDLDERGLVRATEDGAETPEGTTVTLGPPPVAPPPRPETAAPDTSDAVALALAGPRPRPRPDGLVERNERAELGGRSRAELAGLRPAPRPPSAQATAMAALPETAPPSDQAVGRSLQPKDRPDNFDATVAALRARAEDRPQRAVASAAPSQPQIPSSASVARQATIEDALNLRRVNLIGVYGTASDRRALVRLPSGRYIKVKVGDSVDGGQVAAISDGELRYVKRGRNVTLKVPSG